MLAVAIVGALANAAGLLLLRRGQAESLNVRGAYLEVLADLLGSVAVIVAAVLIMLTGWTRFDAMASLLIFVLIVPRAWSLLREVVDVLLEATPRGVDLDAGPASTSAGWPAWSTCTTCTSGRSPAGCRCCPRTWSWTRPASARAARARCWTGSASAWAGTSTSSTAPSSWSRSATRTTSRCPMPESPAPFTAPLDVAGRRVLVCGGGPAALGPVRALLEAGAQVTVVGTEIGTTIRDLGARNLLATHARPVHADDLTAWPSSSRPAATGRPTPGRRTWPGRPACSPPPRVRRTPRPSRRSAGPARSILVGGGPGSLDLLTLGGLEAIRRADVIVTDRLAPLAALDQARPDAQIIDVAKIPRGASTSQEQINRMLVEHATAGRTVVRFKGGDSFVFGRGGEEWQACAAAGVPVTVLPGVSSAIAGPALAGIPLTHRDLTQGFTVISGHLPPGDPGSTLDWAALAAANTTLVIMMGVATLPAITAALLEHGLSADRRRR